MAYSKEELEVIGRAAGEAFADKFIEFVKHHGDAPYRLGNILQKALRWRDNYEPNAVEQAATAFAKSMKG